MNALIKNFLLVPVVLTTTWISAPNALAQGNFQETFAGSVVGGQFSAAKQTYDGGYIQVGTTFQGVGSTDVLLIKVDADGVLEWSSTFGAAADNEYGHDVVQANDGGYVIAARSYSLGPGWYDAYVIKTDSAGALQWSKTLGGPQNDRANSIALTSDGGYIVAGETENFGAGGLDFYLFRLDAAGNLLWTRTWGGVGTEYAHAVQQSFDGGFIVTGYGGSFGSGFWAAYLIKTDSSGNVLWSRAFGGADDERAYSVIETSDFGYAIAGYTSDLGGAGSWDAYVVKTDGAGVLLWSKAYGGAGIDIANSIRETEGGGLIIAGETQSFGAGSRDLYVVRTDSLGNELWSMTYGSASSEIAYSIEETTDGGFAVHGTRGSDYYLVKTDDLGASGCEEAAAATVTTASPATLVVSGGTSGSGGTFAAAASLVTVPTINDTVLCQSPCNATETSFCAQTLPTSVAGCAATLSVCDPTLATGGWDTTNIPRSGTLGAAGTTFGIYIYNDTTVGQSTFTASNPFGTLCLNGFKRSFPACAPLLISHPTWTAGPGACTTSTSSLATDCNGGALGLSVGDDLNVQFWFRDPTAGDSGAARFSNAVFYTLL